MSRRLFQRLEQGVKRLAGEHVDFVNDVDFEPASGRSNIGALPQSADFVDAAVGRAVDFQNVRVVSGCDRPAGLALAARFRRRSVDAVERLGKNSGG